ncbi:hypothetical protein [Micromonospora parathelypteridis]|uniref:Uncharacterized protein n=1 Tax=Micromonospora parathelypteridis TaxID=1839617 RepID=A0A840VQ59_9ACTN|nr:hypothetical protein [Micromonospora parathelypteridis]MBB5479172.1 hypothetical protein [Micromonospora parathelypteridis]GGO02637.1 hypothetical protein GCM10011576_02280 [Micromonospora parathelypteridis]
MRLSGKRPIHAAALVLSVVAVGTLAVAAPASARAPESATLVVTGDPDDPITEGEGVAFSTASGGGFDVWGTANHLTVQVFDPPAGPWKIELSAPVGQPLAVGTYTGATGNTYESPLPGIDLSGADRICSFGQTGSFTVTDISWGPHGYLERFDATFEQRCNYSTGSARGEVHVENPPAPPVLAVGVDVAGSGTIDTGTGEVTVHGTVTCSAPATVYVEGAVHQTWHGQRAEGIVRAEAACTPGAPVAWTSSTPTFTSVPFRRGAVTVSANALSYDTTYDVFVSDADTAVVRLKKG